MSRIPSLGPRGEGWVVLQFSAIGLVIASAGYSVPVDEPMATLARLGGQALILAGGGLVVWGSVALRGGQAFSILPTPPASGELVESGPYRLIRNPIYSGLVITALGGAATRHSLATLGATVVLFLVLDLKRRREEVFLAARYPDYDAYRRRTKALIPWVY